MSEILHCGAGHYHDITNDLLIRRSANMVGNNMLNIATEITAKTIIIPLPEIPEISDMNDLLSGQERRRHRRKLKKK